MSSIIHRLGDRAGLAWLLAVAALLAVAVVGGTVFAATQQSPEAAPSAAVSAAPLAHEHAEAGPYEITLGFGSEPAVAGEINSLFIEIVEKASGEQVEGIGQIEYSVTYAGTTQHFTAGVAWGETSVYEPPILPVMPGHYTVDITFTDADDNTYTLENLPRDVAPRAQYAVPATGGNS